MENHKKITKNKNTSHFLKKTAILVEENANNIGIHLSNIFTPHSYIIPNPNNLNKISNFIDNLLPIFYF